MSLWRQFSLAGANGFLGSIGSTLLSSVGVNALFTGASVFANILLPGVGALVGTVLGNLIGDWLSDVFGWDDGPDSFWGQQTVVWDASLGAFRRGSLSYDPDIAAADIANLKAMADGAVAALNGYLDKLGGEVVFASGLSASMSWTAATQSFSIGASSAGQEFSNSNGDGVVAKAALANLKALKVAGGDPYMKRALANSQAQKLEQLNGDLQVAADYAAYLKNRPVIDAIIAQDSQSAFAAGWGRSAANDNRPAGAQARLAA